jgi:small conductance mechanosensitive channel
LREIIIRALSKHPKLAKELDVDVWLDKLGESDMKLTARSWVSSVDYWPAYWEQLEAVKKELDQEGIEIPFPRRTVYQGSPTINK